jgi:hypothetical protein
LFIRPSRSVPHTPTRRARARTTRAIERARARTPRRREPTRESTRASDANDEKSRDEIRRHDDDVEQDADADARFSASNALATRRDDA